MACNGCGDKDVKEIAKEGARMARELTTKLSGKAPEEPKEAPEETPPAPPRVIPLKKLTEAQSDLIRAKLTIAREAREAAEELISMAMPNAPDGIRVIFDPGTMTFYQQETD